MLERNKLSWYHDLQEYRTGRFIGSTNLTYMYEVMKVPSQGCKDQVELWAFQMAFSDHQSRKSLHAGRRTIIIACRSELIRDRWLAAIEYLKTKAIFDAYAKKNTLVNFMGD